MDNSEQSMRSAFDELLRKSCEYLDEDDLCELFDYAVSLAERPRLVGGPFDGLKIDCDPNGDYGSCYYINLDTKRVAIYEEDEEEVMRFTGTRKKGEGCMPDVYPEKLIR